MTRSHAARIFLGLLLACWFGLPAAQARLDIIGLQHRTAEEILPQLQAFIEPGGSLAGRDDKLFVRASPGNLAQLRTLIAALDVPARRLRLTVTSDSNRVANYSRGDTAQSWSSSSQGRMDVQVQTLDGAQASVHVGESLLLPLRQVFVGPSGVVVDERLVVRDVGRGFTALPRVSGDSVTVDIAPQDARLGTTPGDVRHETLSTRVSGRLGEWIALGGNDDAVRDDGARHYGARGSRAARQWWLRVDQLP